MKTKDDYISEFANLKRNHQFGRPAPQKSIYYLAIIDVITCGFISSNHFSFIPQLKSKFFDYWSMFIGDEETYKADISQPAFYCDGDPFYRLVTLPGAVKKRWTTEKAFSATYKCLEIDEELFNYLSSDSSFAARIRVLLVSALMW